MTAAEFLPSVVNTDKLGMLAGRVGIELVETAIELEILLASAGFYRGGRGLVGSGRGVDLCRMLHSCHHHSSPPPPPS